jgi:hydrogenase nickel incorporation protein HypA/HybF
MHELAVTQEVLRIALDKAREVKAKRVTDINLVIGELSGIIDDSVQFYFDFLAKDSIAEQAKLHFKRVDTKVCCRQCGIDFQPEILPAICPSCQAVDARIKSGREFFVESIEVDE